MMAVWKWAPALAAGNTLVLKPSDTTPVSTLVMAELMGQILPPGVLNVVCGERETGELGSTSMVTCLASNLIVLGRMTQEGGITGTETLRPMAARSVIMISSNEQQKMVEACIRAGADSYLFKPLRIADFSNIWQFVMQQRCHKLQAQTWMGHPVGPHPVGPRPVGPHPVGPHLPRPR